MDIFQQQKIERYIMFFFLGILLALFWWYDIFNFRTFDGNYNDEFYKINSVEIGVDVAQSEEQLQQGFSNRKEPQSYQGILFKFEANDSHSIWMKDMHFAIDVIWLDENLKVIKTLQYITPKTYPKTFSGPKNSRYILEMPTGFLEMYHIGLGQKLQLIDS